MNNSSQQNGAVSMSVPKVAVSNSKVSSVYQSRSTTKLKTNLSKQKFDISQLDTELSKTNRKQLRKRKANENRSMVFMTEVGGENNEN